MSDMQPPPPDYEQIAMLTDFDVEPPPYLDEPYPDDWYDYVPEDEPFIPPSEIDISSSTTPLTEPIASNLDSTYDVWDWQDTRLIGIDRGETAGERRYEIGGIDVYANQNTDELNGQYLKVVAFTDATEAREVFHDLQKQIHDEAIPVHELSHFVQEQTFHYLPEPENWREAQIAEYQAYEQLTHSDDVAAWWDMPPDDALDPLIETAIELGGVLRESSLNEPPFREEQQALADIGIQADSFDPESNPPPFYDEATGTAYWIGIFQADVDDPENCVASILSLGRDADSGELVAHLAPCVSGHWDKTHDAAEYLIDIAQRAGIESCFDAAEGMALATEQRNIWQDERGVPLEYETTQGIAEIARDNWEVDL